MTHRLNLLALAFALAPVGICAAQPTPAPWSLSGEAAIVSDYRFRGLSLSGEDPALQGGLTLSHITGGYGSIWGSTIEEYGTGPDGRGARAEVDFALGWSGALRGLDVDVAAQGYLYPGANGVDAVELPVTVSKTLNAWTWTLGGAYAPRQSALGDRANLYGWAGLAWTAPASPLKVSVQAGHEDGGFAPGGKWDWSASVTRAVGPVGFSLSYVDSDRDASALVAGLTAGF